MRLQCSAKSLLASVAALWLFAVLACNASPSNIDERMKRNQEAVEDRKPKIELLSVRSERSSRTHIRLYGEIRNISPDTLDDLWVVATFRDDAGDLIRSDDFIVEQRNIPPGGTAPFMTISKFAEDMNRFEVSFRTTHGNVIGHVDNRRERNTSKSKAEKK